MPYYRLRHLRPGHFTRSNEIEAADDVAAVRLARSLLMADPAELWCGERRITTFCSPEVPS